MSKIVYPWSTLNASSGGLHGLTTIVANEAQVSLQWMSFAVANHAYLQGYTPLFLTLTSQEEQTHKFLTMRDLRKTTQDPKVVIFNEPKVETSASIISATLDPQAILTTFEKKLQSQVKRMDLVVADLDDNALTIHDILTLMLKLNELAKTYNKPSVLVVRGPFRGEEAEYLAAMNLFSTTEIWVKKGPTLFSNTLSAPPVTNTLDLQAHRKGQYLSGFLVASDIERGDFRELPVP